MSLDLERDRGGYRNGPPAREKVEHCVRQLERADEFEIEDGWKAEIAHGLTVEEAVGALLHAADEL